MSNLRLFLNGNEVCARTNGDDRAVPVSIVWARPISAPGKEVSIVSGDKELALLGGLHELDDESRAIAEDALDRAYLIPRIHRITRTALHMGNRYFDVETDCGARSFIVKNPFTCIRPVGEDGLMIRDVIGNLFVILSVKALDARSRGELELVV